jgi:hypothetical protein
MLRAKHEYCQPRICLPCAEFSHFRSKLTSLEQSESASKSRALLKPPFLTTDQFKLLNPRSLNLNRAFPRKIYPADTPKSDELSRIKGQVSNRAT